MFLTAVFPPVWADSNAVDFENQVITIALTQEPPQLNGMKATDTVSFFVLGHVTEGLVRYNQRGQIMPAVAESWDIREDGATFHLRKDALWSDGKPVRAQDFVFAWRNVLDPATASEYAFILYPLKNAETINRGQQPTTALGVEALDDQTLEIEFESSTGYFDKLLAFITYYPAREDFVRAKGERYAADAADLLYNGPFVMTEWKHSASLKMVKNERYWNREAIHLNEIHADYITADTRSRLNLFIDNKIVHTRLNGETYKDALTQRLKIRRFDTGSLLFLEYNHRPERVTSNLALRKAVQHIYDPVELVDKVLATPGNLPGVSLFPAWLNGVEGKFRDEYPARKAELNQAIARQLIEQAKHELGVEEIPALSLVVSDSPTAIKQAEYVQQVFKSRLGIDIRIDIQTFKQRLAKMSAGDFDIVSAGWGPDFDDVMTFGDLFASWNLNNRGRYTSPEYDKWVRVAQNSTVPKVRMDAMAEVQRIVFEDVVIQPQYEQGVIYLMHNKVRGVVRRVTGSDPDYTYARVIR